MRLILSVAAAAALSACQTSVPAEARQPSSTQEGLLACGAAKSAVLARLEAQHSACTEDSDCVPFAQVWLGCAGWRNVRTPLPDGAEGSLYSACTGIPTWALDCRGNVGACVKGRCTGRERAGANCAAATTSLVLRASAPSSCQQDPDCRLRWIDGAAHPVGASFDVDAARELHALADSCDDETLQRLTRHGASNDVPRCAEATCGLASSAAPPTKYERPGLVDPGCVKDRLSALLDRAKAGIRGKATVKLVIGRSGGPGAFEFIGPVPKGLHEPIIWALAGCRWNPGRQNGEPVPMWVLIPLDFQ